MDDNRGIFRGCLSGFSIVLVAVVLIGVGRQTSQGVTADSTSPATHRIAQANGGGKSDKSEDKARQTAQPWTGSPLGPDGAFEDPNREQALQIERVIDALRIGTGSRVADIGAGGGWFTVRAARRVGPTGIIYAQEILPKYTSYIEQRAEREGLANVRTILGTTNDPKLPVRTMDAVLILNAYHEFEYPLAMLRKIYSAMKPGARLGLIERDNETLRREARQAYTATGKIKRRVDEQPDSNPYTDDHHLAREIVEGEATLVGFRKVATISLNSEHYLVVVARD